MQLGQQVSKLELWLFAFEVQVLPSMQKF